MMTAKRATSVCGPSLLAIVWLALPGPASASEVPPPLDFFSLIPCRVVDTRTTGGPLLAGLERTFPFAGACGIPSAAAAVSVNVAVTEPTAAGNLRLYAAGSPVPISSTINYAAGQTRTNNAIVGVGAGGELAARIQPAGSTHLVVDVNGYFAARPTAFRLTSLGLISPRIVVNVPFGGCQDITQVPPIVFGSPQGDSVNDTFAREIRPTSMGGDYSLHVLSVFRPLDPAASPTPIELHFDGACMEGPTPDACGPAAVPDVVTCSASNLSSGTCFTPVPADVNTRAGTPAAYVPTANTVSAPCFVSDEQLLWVPFFGGMPIPLDRARVSATYSGTPPDLLVTGVITGFLPETTAADIVMPASIPLYGGEPFYSLLQAGNRAVTNSTGASVSDGCNVSGGASEDDADPLDADRGFWFFLNFTAEVVTWTGP